MRVRKNNMLKDFNEIFINTLKFIPYLIVIFILTIILVTPVFLLYIKYGYAVASLPVLVMVFGLYIYIYIYIYIYSHYYKKYSNISIGNNHYNIDCC